MYNINCLTSHVGEVDRADRSDVGLVGLGHMSHNICIHYVSVSRHHHNNEFQVHRHRAADMIDGCANSNAHELHDIFMKEAWQSLHVVCKVSLPQTSFLCGKPLEEMIWLHK